MVSSNSKSSGFLKNRIIILVLVSLVSGVLTGALTSTYFYFQIKDHLEKFSIPSVVEEEAAGQYLPQTSQEKAIVDVVQEVSPAVVSIIISKDVPIIEEYFYNPFQEFNPFLGPIPEFQIPQYRQNGTEKKEVGGGTGFIVSEDGMILTNKHVVLDEEAEYTVFTNDGKEFTAQVLARDPVQDIAVLKITQEKTVTDQGETLKSFPIVKLGDSDKLQIGQTVIAIGNALGEFKNTVSVGVISGLGRSILASGGGLSETLEDVIQTDAAINKGNSGGPLLNLKGEVIGINTAIAEQAQSIGFSIPANKAKRAISQVKSQGKIVYPFLGVRYLLVNEKIKNGNDLGADYGAWITAGEAGESAITPGSAAERAGLKEDDIILEFNGEKITQNNSLVKVITKYNPGDAVFLKILRDGQEITADVVLGEREE